MHPANEDQNEPVQVDQDTAAAWDAYGNRSRKRAIDPRFRPAEQDCE